MAVDPRAAGAADDVLTRLVGDRDRFAREHWGRAPVLRRGAWGDRPPLDLDDVDRLLTSSGLRWPALRLVREGTTLPASGYTRSGRIGGQRVTDLVDHARALELFAEGATIVLQGLHRYHPPVADLCDELDATLGHPVQANAYLTPPASRGLNVHHDTHDVLALQAHGHKRWVVHEPAVTSPLPSQPWSSAEHEPGPLLLDTTLEPGDVLYLPRGAAHAAATVGEVSLHLTIGVRTVTWHDVARTATGWLADDESLRESLPLGFLDEPEALREALAARLRRAGDALASAPPDALVERLLEERRRRHRPRLRGQLRELVGLDEIDDDTCVRRRDEVPVEITASDERVLLRLADRDVALPSAARGLLVELLDGAEHRVGDLADRLDEESRGVLVRRLVREGVLRTDGGPRG